MLTLEDQALRHVLMSAAGSVRWRKFPCLFHGPSRVRRAFARRAGDAGWREAAKNRASQVIREAALGAGDSGDFDSWVANTAAQLGTLSRLRIRVIVTVNLAWGHYLGVKSLRGRREWLELWQPWSAHLPDSGWGRDSSVDFIAMCGLVFGFREDLLFQEVWDDKRRLVRDSICEWTDGVFDTGNGTRGAFRREISFDLPKTGTGEEVLRAFASPLSKARGGSVEERQLLIALRLHLLSGICLFDR